MAINVSFNGSTIYKPGAYSQEIIDLGGGFPLSPTGLIALFGESSSGTPGAQVTNIANNVFTPDQMPAIIAEYGSGNLVDACNFLFAPGADGAIPAGAQAVYIYKTNASTLASLALGGSPSFGTIESLTWGTQGNLITYQNTLIPASTAMDSSSAPINLVSSYFAGPTSSPSINTAIAIQGQSDASAAFTSMNAMAATAIPSILDGQTLTPGVYKESSGTFNLAASGAGTLTLNGAGVYIFQAASTLVTGAGGTPTITLTGGATAANVYWMVGSSATINSGHTGTFQGSIIAEASITNTAGGTVNGSMIALTGAVTDSAATVIHAQNSPLLNSAGAFGILGASAVTGSAAGDTVTGLVGIAPGTSVTNFPPGTIAGGLTLTLVLRVNGGAANTYTASGAVTSVAALQASLNLAGNWSGGLPAGLTFTVSGTNAAASVAIAMTVPGNFELISGSLLGTGNGSLNILPGLISSESPAQTLITITNYGTGITESGTVGGTLVLELGRYGAGGVTPTVTINSTNMILTNNSMAEATIPLASFNTIAQLVLYINTTQAGVWSAAVGSTLTGQYSPSVMDQVTAAPAASSSSSNYPVQITNNANQVAAFFAASANVSLVQTAGQGVSGFPPVATETYLAGGTLGGTSTSAIVDALAAFQAVRVNSVVPLFSRDATKDIADMLTDPSSTYTLAGVNQAVKTHLSLMATTKEKSERQGYLSMHDTYNNCTAMAATMADARIQLVIQDIYQSSASGVIQWYQPWAGACLLAGARGGSPVGNPMTFKYFNMSGIRQTGQPMTTPAQNIVIDFNPATEYDQAIQAGITFWEAPQTGGFRLVVDNTTYGQDANWVYNRANVLYAADVLAYDFRSQMENIYIGLKNTTTASEIASTASSILQTYLAQGITVSTSDAKNGFKQLVVQINGNVVNISVTVKLVEGIDFILATITLQRVSQTNG
jgi:type VI secretion system secreted protein VgrG